MYQISVLDLNPRSQQDEPQCTGTLAGIRYFFLIFPLFFYF